MNRNRNKMSYKMIYCGDCLKVMPEMDAASVDAIVTDPPYGLSFMGRDWDHGVPGEAFWREALRVAKPGTHLLAFGGTRTYHRLACAIEDAGWEVRDCIMWVYGSGFPKSLDVSKAIDKAAGAEREVVGENPNHRAVSGVGYDGVYRGGNTGSATITAPATDAARQWSGWGTALKPAYEPIIVARKPLVGTVAENVTRYGTGAVNVDGCRVVRDKEDVSGWSKTGSMESENRAMSGKNYLREAKPDASGRWPANLIHDGSDEVVGLFPQNAGAAARFFYCAKASKADRGEGNAHPTVKPTALMRYLCRLVTPPGGVVLDPFAGSGSTGKAAVLEGFSFIGIELNAEYVEIARARIKNAKKKSKKKSMQ